MMNDLELRYYVDKPNGLTIEQIDADIDRTHNLLSRMYEYRRELINYKDLNKRKPQNDQLHHSESGSDARLRRHRNVAV